MKPGAVGFLAPDRSRPKPEPSYLVFTTRSAAVLVSPYIGIKMAQKGIEDANDILAPTDNKRDLKARAGLVYGNRCEASLVSFAAPLPPNLGRPDAALSPLSLLSTACTPHSLALRRASRACHATTHTSPPALLQPYYRQGNDPDAGGPPKFPWQK